MALLTFDDILEPAGPIDPVLFPNTERRDIEARVTSYLTRAYADPRIAALVAGSVQNAAALAYAKWRCYLAVYTEMVRKPITLAVTEKGSHGYSMEQIRAMKALADEAKAELDAVFPTITDEPEFGAAVNRYVF